MSEAQAHADKVNFIWSVKEVLRDHYKRHQYGEVILPLCLLRRLDCVLAESKSKVVAKAATIRGDLDAHEDVLAHVAGLPFYNASKFTFETLLDDPEHISQNVFDYVQGFSPNARLALDKFDITSHVNRMEDAGILFIVVQRFAGIDLHPESVTNLAMGYIYEELIRVNAALSNEEAGEHFTPREVIRLMVNLLFADEDQLLTPGKIATIYDPACGTGGMLSVAEDYLKELNPKARLHMYGQEVQPESWAICQSDMMIRDEKSVQIAFGNSFTQDGFDDKTFDYMLANPPYGKDWKPDETFIKTERATLGVAGRFGAGLPPTSDGQILFLQQMISKMRSPEEGGSRIGVVMNGSPLFSGDAGTGYSEIRRWIIENDWLEAIVGLPEQLFYNTGIFTYIWVITNRKRPERQGFVQLIDARQSFERMKKSLGKKRNELSEENIAEITNLFETFSNGDISRVLPNSFFGYRKLTIERPLRLRYHISSHAISELYDTKAFLQLPEPVTSSIADGLNSILGTTYSDVQGLKEALAPVFKAAGKVPAPARKAVELAFSSRDSKAGAVPGVPDPHLRDTENIPLGQDIDKFLATEILPFAPDAWVDHSKTKIGYDVPFTRQFYRYVPPRLLADIDRDIQAKLDGVITLMKLATK